MHYGPSESMNLQTEKIQETIIGSENPQFIAYTGDMICGGDGGGAQGYVRRILTQSTLPANDSKTPYAITIGNHDTEV